MFRFFDDCLFFFAQFLYLGRTEVDLVPDFSAGFVFHDGILALSRAEIAAVTVDFIFVSRQQLGYFGHVVDICRRCLHRMHQSAVQACV